MKAKHLLILYGLTVFSGAFLLFQVQPLMGKYLLPWFGGAPEVWTTCLLFFQFLLLAGYSYAHGAGTYLPLRGQLVLHSLLCLAALALVHVVPRASLEPKGQSYAVVQIILILLASIGLPYFVLASTGPLLQRWWSRTHRQRSPYLLYAVSNGASLLALLSYPFLVEPNLTRQAQARMWTAGLALYVLFSIGCVVFVGWLGDGAYQDVKMKKSPDHSARPARQTWLAWLLLPAVAAVLLMAVTNIICQDVAAVPFLWILPLSLYLLTFVVCFCGEKYYARQLFRGVFFILLIATVFVWVRKYDVSVIWQICVYVSMLFAACMVCHGELYRLRPDATYLTGFYLMIAAGGAVGGLFVVGVAPLVFNSYLELHLGLLACCAVVLLTDKAFMKQHNLRSRLAWPTALALAGMGFYLVEGRVSAALGHTVKSYRDFFGVLRVLEVDEGDPARHAYVLQHGNTVHGLQFTAYQRRSAPTTYYGRTSGVGLVMRALEQQGQHRVGVVGLGVGTLAAYARAGDYLRFYEINPSVYRLAQERFTYLRDCPAQIDVVMGDARLSLEHEASQQFDILVLDAFSSDAVPVHLMTQEAFQVYLRHLKPQGVIAFHTSNAHLDLESVVIQMARHLKMDYVWIRSSQDEDERLFASDWILLTKNKDLLRHKLIQNAVSAQRGVRDIRLWTDDFANLFEILE